VVEPRRTERVAEVVREPFVLAQHDPGHDGAAFAVEPRRDGPRKPCPQPVGHAGHTAAAPDASPAAALYDHVDALALEPRPLVEPVVGRPGPAQGRDELQPGALRRRTSCGQLEEHALAHPPPIPSLHHGRDAKGERRAANRSRRDHGCRSRLADVRPQRRAVERVEPDASPTDPDQRGRRRADRQRVRRPGRRGDEHEREAGERKRRDPEDERG
jgi:hypothetical protein